MGLQIDAAISFPSERDNVGFTGVHVQSDFDV
jgi:hypothetical protein